MKIYKYILPLFFLALISSCENMDQEMSDDELIQAIIESDNRISVTKNDLPKSAISTLNFKMPEDVIRLAELAPELGFEIEMKSWDFFDFELDYERNDNKYFTTEGRELESTKENKDGWGDKKNKDGKDNKKKRGPCFKFVYPISYTMGDSSEITGNDRKEIHSQMKAYFEKNGKTKENKPSLNFPLQIMILDDNKNVLTKDILNIDDLKLTWEYCRGSKKEDGDKKTG